MNTKTLFIEAHAKGLLTDDERDTLMLAVASRGKNKGRIRDTLPPASKPRARGVWRSVMGSCSAARASLMGLMLASAAERDAFTECEGIIERVFSQGAFASLLSATEGLRFNLRAMNHRTDRPIDDSIRAVLDGLAARKAGKHTDAG